jgi:hypothetical protein
MCSLEAGSAQSEKHNRGVRCETTTRLLCFCYNKKSECIVAWVTIVNMFTRQRVHRQPVTTEMRTGPLRWGVFYTVRPPKTRVDRRQLTERDPCGGEFEYLHHDPANHSRRRKGKSQIWESKIWSRVPRDSEPRKTALARASSMYIWQTRSLVREETSQKQDRNCQTVINIWTWAPNGARHQDLLTDWLTVSRNVTLTLTERVQKCRSEDRIRQQTEERNTREFQKARGARCRQQWGIRDPERVEWVNCYNWV